MKQYDESNKEQVAEFVLEQIRHHILFTLATVDNDNRPWVVCLGLTVDDNVDIIWKSSAIAEHSKHIRGNPYVSLCIFSHSKDEGDFGFYAKAAAREITDPTEIIKYAHYRYARQGKPVPTADELLTDVGDRLYVARIQEAWVNDSRHVKTPVDVELMRNISSHIAKYSMK